MRPRRRLSKCYFVMCLCRARCSSRALVAEQSSESYAGAALRSMRPTSMTMEQPRTRDRDGYRLPVHDVDVRLSLIVMNPPFSDAEAHVRHALKLLPDHGTLAVLLRMIWIAAKGRADLLKHCHADIIAGRLKMLPPGARDRGQWHHGFRLVHHEPRGCCQRTPAWGSEGSGALTLETGIPGLR